MRAELISFLPIQDFQIFVSADKVRGRKREIKHYKEREKEVERIAALIMTSSEHSRCLQGKGI